MAALYHGTGQVAHSEPEEADLAGFNTPHQTSIINSCKAVVQPYFLPRPTRSAGDAIIRYKSAPPTDTEVAEQSGTRAARDILTRGTRARDNLSARLPLRSRAMTAGVGSGGQQAR
jgi:hypothetical protein